MSYPTWFFYVTFRDGWEDTYRTEGITSTDAMGMLLDGFLALDEVPIAARERHGDIVKIELVEPKEETDA